MERESNVIILKTEDQLKQYREITGNSVLVFYYSVLNASSYHSLLSQLKEVHLPVDMVVLPAANSTVPCNNTVNTVTCFQVTFYPGFDLLNCDNIISSGNQVCLNEQFLNPVSLILFSKESIEDILVEKLPQLTLTGGSLSDIPVRASLKFEEAMDYFL
jgi:hypothetical protein